MVGFLKASDPRMRTTMAQIQAQLTDQGLVNRYREDDGLPGREATFTPCAFWLAENLALAGRLEEAWEQFARVVAWANDVGLLSEEINPASGELLGNFPQGLSHLALIRTAVRLTALSARRLA
jgi:GH15 family glucan-1,4-alpha-glucosidase